MGFRHGAAEIVLSCQGGAMEPDRGGEEGADGAEPAEETGRFIASRVAEGGEEEGIGEAVGKLVVEVAIRRFQTAFYGEHAIHEVAE